MHFMRRAHSSLDIDCPEGEECEVEIRCNHGECDCSLNGQSVDCEELHTELDPGD
jgi:hypothetical protein